MGERPRKRDDDAWKRIAGGENGLKFVDKQNYSSFSGRNNFLGIYPGDTLNCSCTGVRNSYDALARARPRIKGGISASRNLRDLSRGKFLTASSCHEFIGFCNFFVVFGLLDKNACIWYKGDVDSLVYRKSRYLTSKRFHFQSNSTGENILNRNIKNCNNNGRV